MKTKVTKADRRRKAKANPVIQDGLTTSFIGWSNASYQSAQRANGHFHTTRDQSRPKRAR